jgi:AcrR family transcriptional regulator
MPEVLVGRRRTKRSAPTKEAILEAAGKMLAEHGYEATSLDSVALEAGVTKATLYYHFESKEAIYAGVLTRYLNESLMRVQDAIAAGGSSTDVFLRVLDSMLDDTMATTKRYIHYQEIVRTDEDTHERIRNAQRRYEDAVADIIRRGQEDGEIMPGDPKARAFLTIGTIGRTARWYRPGGRIPVQEFRDMLCQFLLGGMLRGENRNLLDSDKLLLPGSELP